MISHVRDVRQTTFPKTRMTYHKHVPTVRVPFDFIPLCQMILRQGTIRYAFHLAIKKNKYRKKGKAKGGKYSEGIVISECIFLLSRFSRTHLYRVLIYPTAPSFNPPILTFLLPCSAFAFFLHPRETRSTFLGR